MTTPHQPRPARVASAAFVIILGAAGIGGVLALITRAITGHASPVPDTPPWQWSLRDIARWFSTDATSSSALDVAVRLLAAVAWIALALIVVNLLRELAHQSRHGVIHRRPQAATEPTIDTVATPPRPKVRRQHSFAATLIAILLGSATVTAGTVAALPARAPAAVIADSSLNDHPATSLEPAIDATAGAHWTTYTVTSPHESLASIARQIGDEPALARNIWDANTGRDMGNGDRFTDPAVVKPGWTLRIPTPRSSTTPVTAPSTTQTTPPPAQAAPSPTPQTTVPTTTDSTPTTHIVITQTGDTLWDLIDDVVDTPTVADIDAVAAEADGATTPLGPWVFHAGNPDLIHTGMPFDLQPAIDLHDPSGTPDDAATVATPDPAAPTTVDADAADSSPSTPAPTTTTAGSQGGNGVDSATVPAAAPDPAGTGAETAANPVDTAPPAVPATTAPTDEPSETTGAEATPTPVPTVAPTVATSPVPADLPGPATPVSTVSAAHRDDVAPSVDHARGDIHDDTSSLPVVPLAVAGMTIAGLLGAIDWRRRRRQTHDPHGRAVTLPSDDLAADERVMRSAARLDRAARANAALRHLSAELATRATVLRSRYILVTDNAVTVVLSEPAQPPAGWDEVDDPIGWRCLLDDRQLAHVADVSPHPWPAVVPLGVTVHDDTTVLVDLEAYGITSLTGPGGADVVAAMICALGASPTADAVTVVDDGHVALYGLDRYLTNRIQLDSLDAVVDRLGAWTEPFRFEGRHLLAQRYDDPGELEPCIAAVVAVIDDHARRRLQALPSDGTRPLAVITTYGALGHTVIDVDPHGITEIDGLTVRCHRLTPVVADVTHELVAQADTAPMIDPADDRTTPVEQPTLFPPSPDAWHVQLLGPLRIHHDHHGDLSGGRSRQLLALLALHPDGLTAEDIYDAVVPHKIADPDNKRSYVKARMTELRKLLGDGDTVAGRSYLPLTSTAGTDRYHVEVVDVDVARFRRLSAHPDDVLADLTAAMELIDGPVGDGEASWYPWAMHIVHELHAVIVDTGRRLADTAIAAGQPTLADWAATQTRLAVPFDQSVVPLAIRARCLLGDRVGVRRLRDEIVDTHDGDLASDVKAAFDDALAAG